MKFENSLLKLKNFMFKATPFKLWGNLCWKGALGRAMFVCMCVCLNVYVLEVNIFMFIVHYYFFSLFLLYYFLFSVSFFLYIFSCEFFSIIIIYFSNFMMILLPACNWNLWHAILYILFYISSGSSSILNTFSRYYCFFSSFFSFIFNINIL